MSNQLLMDFDAPPANRTATSRAAAITQSVTRTEQQKRDILKALRDAPGGLIREEIADVTGIAPDAVRPRVWKLRDEGKVFEEGTRLTKSGCSAAVVHFGEAK